MPYGLAVAFGTLYSLLIALASCGTYVIALWSDNVTPEEAASNVWLLFVAAVMFVGAAVFFMGVMTRRLWLVIPAFLASGAAGITAVWYALVEVSDHGDGEVIAFTLGCGLAGLLAVALTAWGARDPIEST
jgi:hypothetical protein